MITSDGDSPTEILTVDVQALTLHTRSTVSQTGSFEIESGVPRSS